MQNKNFTLAVMIWATIVIIWAVNTLTGAIRNAGTVTVQSPSPQQEPQRYSTVQIDKDTVWVIDYNSPYLKIITHDEVGYHMTQKQMDIRNN